MSFSKCHCENSVAFARKRSDRTKIFLCISFVIFYMLCLAPEEIHGIQWLGIYRLPRSADHPVDSTADRFTNSECHKATNELGLRRRQSRFCSHPRLGYAMLAVLRAAHAVGYHCPKAFADRRWNCTSIHRLPEVSPELKRGTREKALVHAFSSAALLFEIGRYCALNKIRFCSCGDENAVYPPSDYQSGEGEMKGSNTYGDSGGALVYESGMEENGANSPMSSGLNDRHSTSMTEGQPTVSRFYWAGCSDNLRVARKYASEFLGFPNTRALTSSPSEMDRNELNVEEDLKLDRITRAAYFEDEIPLEPDEDESFEQQDFKYHSSDPKDRVRKSVDYNWQYMYQRNTVQPPPYHQYQASYEPFAYRPVNGMPARINNPEIGQNRRRPRRPPTRGRQGRHQINRVMDRHNYLAGVVLMEMNHKLVCKCHGVSGSCAQRVCFRQLRRIDDEVMQKVLKLRYLAAKQVTMGAKRELIAKTFTGAGFVDEVVKQHELVFTEHSPDYCNVEPHRGSVGTHDR
ncbi:hypothetical protein AHF37_09037 [Paragonimus kellicotti]|nr:hypothetical protein AHF37_09037 [Paragonimus kellicotti]